MLGPKQSISRVNNEKILFQFLEPISWSLLSDQIWPPIMTYLFSPISSSSCQKSRGKNSKWPPGSLCAGVKNFMEKQCDGLSFTFHILAMHGVICRNFKKVRTFGISNIFRLKTLFECPANIVFHLMEKASVTCAIKRKSKKFTDQFSWKKVAT